MSSVTLELADAVAATLNAGAFSQEFTAVRSHLPDYDLSEVKALTVTVVPKSLEIAKASRESAYFDAAIDIGVQQKIDGDAEAARAMVDGLIALVEEIVDHLRGRRLEGAPDAVWMAIANDPVFDRDHMERLRVFTGVVTVTYRKRR